MKRILLIVAVFAALSGSAACAADIYTEPYLLTLSPSDTMNVLWLTGENASEAFVEFGEAENMGGKVNAVEHEIKGLRRSVSLEGYDNVPENNPALPVFQQIGEIKGLKPGTKYFYRVTTKIGEKVITGNQYFFKTAPLADSGKTFNFVLISDLQQRPQVLETVKIAGQQDADFILYAGDFQNTIWKTGEWFPVENCFIAPEEKGKEWFTVMQQAEDNTRLLQYMPIFPVPGNHEADDQRIWSKEMATDKTKKTMSIYLQLFRPMYPEQEAQLDGKHWYSADYGDMHIIGLSLFRSYPGDGYEAPGWVPFDSVAPDSPQVKWLENDLSSKNSKYTWVVQHWHMLNRGAEVWIPMSEPLIDPEKPERAVYPYGDNCWNVLRPLYEGYGVNAVNFGHSHVYERYLINGVNYIEAATLGNNYRGANDPLHFSGIAPVFEQNDFRSCFVVTVTPDQMLGRAIAASEEGSYKKGDVFDSFIIANLKGTEPDKDCKDEIKAWLEEYGCNTGVHILAAFALVGILFRRNISNSKIMNFFLSTI
ncbi:MAG: metallophosphoesterase family protein [Synergistaceae bacterium]|nr:metallophosphoesterase family protein [Synergistaceae bacterium]